MTARISLIPEETRGHRPRLQLRDFDFMGKAGFAGKYKTGFYAAGAVR